MTTWLSTHGVGAIKDTASTFAITVDRGSAVVRPTSANQLTGWIHFVIPSPPANNLNLKKFAVHFPPRERPLRKWLFTLPTTRCTTWADSGQFFELDIPSTTTTTYTDKGIAVVVFPKFTNVSLTLDFQSVAIQV